jgi:hypothetical protein
MKLGPQQPVLVQFGDPLTVPQVLRPGTLRMFAALHTHACISSGEGENLTLMGWPSSGGPNGPAVVCRVDRRLRRSTWE